MSLRRAHFFGNLARLTGAGLPIIKAGGILELHARRDSEAKMILSLREGLARGESIATSLQPSLSAVEYGMVSAAESGGRLSEGFTHLEKYYAAVAEAQRRMRTAVIYPLLLLHVAAGASAVPTVMAGGNALPVLATALMILWIVLAILWFGALGVCRLAAKSTLADAILSSLPLAGKAWRLFALSRWSAVLHFHIMSAQKMSAALDAAGAACGSAGLAAATAQLSAVASAGQSVAEEMPRHRIFPSLFCAGFATAEATGNLDEETRQQMQRCLEDATAAVTALAEWLPRLLYTAAVLYAAWQVFRIAAGIFGTYQKALDGF
jgi:type II secretory pathway component PulF